MIQQIPEGQSVVARVTIDGQPEWMLGSVKSFISGKNTYEIEDIFPDQNSQVFVVPYKNVIIFPQQNLKVKKGQKLLTVWYDTQSQSWTSILYPCQVLEEFPDPSNAQSIVIKVKFDGDPKLTYINSQWAVQIPEFGPKELKE